MLTDTLPVDAYCGPAALILFIAFVSLLYALHDSTTLAYGLTQLDDQQLAGVLMAGLGMLPYGALILLRLRPPIGKVLA